jgi:hypothetical protein
VDRGRQTAVYRALGGTERLPLVPSSQGIAEWNPVSAVTQACRELWGNGPPTAADAAWPLQNPVAVSIGSSLVLTAIFAPLAVSAFRRRSRD